MISKIGFLLQLSLPVMCEKQPKIETKQLGTLSGNPFGDKSIHFGRSLKVHQNSKVQNLRA